MRVCLIIPVSGWDPKNGGQVFALPLGGSLVQQGEAKAAAMGVGAGGACAMFVALPVDSLSLSVLLCVVSDWAIGGSGSTYVYGFVDANYRRGMTKEECLEFVARAISHAMARDGSSGGVVRLASIDKEGVQRHYIPGNRLPYMPEKDVTGDKQVLTKGATTTVVA